MQSSLLLAKNLGKKFYANNDGGRLTHIPKRQDALSKEMLIRFMSLKKYFKAKTPSYGVSRDSSRNSKFDQSHTKSDRFYSPNFSKLKGANTRQHLKYGMNYNQKLHTNSTSALYGLKKLQENSSKHYMKAGKVLKSLSKSSKRSDKHVGTVMSRDFTKISDHGGNTRNFSKFGNASKQTLGALTHDKIIMKTTPIATGELIAEDDDLEGNLLCLNFSFE